MTISPFLKTTYRTKTEQMIGLAILLLFCFATLSINSLLSNSYHCICRLFFKCLSLSTFHGIFLVMFSLNTLGFWSIWRKESLRRLKLESTLFGSLFLFTTLWQTVFFLTSSALLSLVMLLFTGSLLLIIMALFWRREKIASCLLIPHFLWITCLSWNNLTLCLN